MSEPEQPTTYDIETNELQTRLESLQVDRTTFLNAIRNDLPVGVTEDLMVLPSRVLQQAKDLARQYRQDGHSVAETACFAGVTYATAVDWLEGSLVQSRDQLTPSQRRHLKAWRLPRREA
jgi:hypothetical protein